MAARELNIKKTELDLWLTIYNFENKGNAQNNKNVDERLFSLEDGLADVNHKFGDVAMGVSLLEVRKIFGKVFHMKLHIF
jgi:hypothetical protein